MCSPDMCFPEKNKQRRRTKIIEERQLLDEIPGPIFCFLCS